MTAEPLTPASPAPQRNDMKWVWGGVAALFAASATWMVAPSQIGKYLYGAASAEDPMFSAGTLATAIDVANLGGKQSLWKLEYAAYEAFTKKDYKAFDVLLTVIREKTTNEDRPVSSIIEECAIKAIAKDNLEALDYLATKYAADFKVKGDDLFSTQASYGRQDSAAAIAEIFVKHGYVATAENMVLERAIENKNFAFADVLVANGAHTDFEHLRRSMGGEPSQKGESFTVPVKTCGVYNNCFTAPVLSWMKKNNIDIHGEDFETTIEAARRNNVEALTFLFANGAGDQNTKDRALRAALIVDKERVNSDAAQFLLARGARADTETADALTGKIENGALLLNVMKSRKPGMAPQ